MPVREELKGKSEDVGLELGLIALTGPFPPTLKYDEGTEVAPLPVGLLLYPNEENGVSEGDVINIGGVSIGSKRSMGNAEGSDPGIVCCMVSYIALTTLVKRSTFARSAKSARVT